MSLLKEASLAYIFDAIRNTFVDDEDKSLGNKLALNDDEFQKLLDIPGVFRASEAPPPPPRPDVQDIEAINRFMRDNPVNKAEGGRINFAAAGLALPALSYPISYGLATALGISTAGGAKVLGDRVTNYIKDNPEILNDPRFKAAALAFGITPSGLVFGPDADQMEKTKKELEGVLKPGETKPIDQGPIVTGGSEPPKIETKETFPAGETMKPIVEGFPAETQQLPIIFENRKAATDDLKEDFDNKSWQDTTIVTGSPAKGTRKSVGQKTNIPFFEKLNTYTKEYHGGNLKSAIKEIGGIQTKPGVRDKTLESLYTSISNAAKRVDFKFDSTGNILQSDIKQSKVLLKLPEFTNQLKTNPGLIDNRIEELKIDKNKIVNRSQLQDIFGLDKTNIRQNNFLFEVLKDQGAEIKNLPGGTKGFVLEDAINTIKDYAKNKLTNYESRKYSSSLKKKSSENYELRSRVDGKDFVRLNSQINKSINKTLGKNDLFLADSVAQIGHNPVPVTFYDKIEMFKDKKLADKIFNIQNYTWQGKEINYDTLAKTSGKLEKALKQLNKVYGKTVTEKNIGKIEDAADDIREYFNSAVKAAGDVSERLPFHKEVIGQIIVSVPEIGDKLTADNFTVDMSNVDSKFIIGNVDLINPNAVKYKDLSKEEKISYGQNIIDQKAEQLREFYGPNGANYPPEIIEDLIEQFEFGDAEALGAYERKSLGFKKGGGVEITPLPRLNFSEGGTDNFAAELEYYLTNPDAELPKMQTFEETLNPIVMINDMIDPRNYPYYADQLVQGGIRVGEFATRILPATGKLISDLVRKPAFKITGASGQGYVQDYDELPQGANIKGTGIFSNFLENITPTAIEKKLGLDKLIEAEEQKMKDRGSTIAPKVLGETLSLGVEFGSPIFPGIKLLKAYAKANNLPVDNVTKKLLEKEVDKVLTERGTSRRKFLQTAGAGASLMIAKMLGLGDEFARTAKVAEKTVAETATGGGVPPYFFQLVEKIKKNGTKFESEFDPRVENNMQFENFALRENLSTGEITITKSTEGGVSAGDDIIEGTLSEEAITYNPGEVIMGRDGRPMKTPVEYEEITVRPDMEGKMKDAEPGLDSIEEIIELLGPNKLKMSELEAAGYNVNAFPDNIKNLLIDDLQKTN